MIEYEKGEIPSVGLGVFLRDLEDNPINTIGYSSVELEMLDSGNRQVNVDDVVLSPIPTEIGAYIIQWPKDRSLFTWPGTYLIRFVLRKSDGSLDFTRPEEISVRDFGRLPGPMRGRRSHWEVD